MFKKWNAIWNFVREWQGSQQGYKRKSGIKGFFRDPNNLKYNLNTIVPLIVFLTSLFALAIGANILAQNKAHLVWVWILGACFFSSFSSFIVMRAMTQPISDLVRKAEQYVKLEKLRKERGKMIEVYNLIEQLMESVRSKTDEGEKDALMKGVQNLDYIIPLGYMSLMVAHEVRNPLSTIMGMNELLKQKVVDESQKRYIDATLQAARKIEVFTKELLDFTDNEFAGEDVDVDDIIDEAVNSLSQELKDITCEFVKKGSLICLADRTKIYQVIHNILKNAANHEKAGGYIKIDAAKGDDMIRIAIYNKHSRVESDDYDAVFKPFFTKRKGGKGIGLFISMRNMKLHGGDIKIESGDNGTTFTIELPVVKGNENQRDAGKSGDA
jgi:signal transduction histidine kinase